MAAGSGAASISPLDPSNAAEAKINVRTEHTPKTFDVQDADAVLTVEVPLVNGAPGVVINKVGRGLLRLTGVNTTTSKLLVSSGTIEIGGAGSLGAGSSAQPLEILADATFRYASSADQTLSGTIACQGTFAKTGAGRLIIAGAMSVSADGVFAVPAAETDANAVRADNLTVAGAISVSNADSLLEGKTYVLLTSATALPTGIAAQVTGLSPRWKVELVDDGQTLLVYKRQGTLIQIQ